MTTRSVYEIMANSILLEIQKSNTPVGLEYYINVCFHAVFIYYDMLHILLIPFFIILKSTSGDKFPSLLTTNATLAIVIDRDYLSDDYDLIKEAIETYLVYAKREILKHGGVNLQYYSWTSINVKRDISALISIASCEDTWRLFNAAEDEHLLHMAISESDCPRLPQDQAITIPMIERGQELPQIILDLRTASAYKWKSVIVFYDDTLERDIVTRVVTSFTAESSNLKVTGSAVSLIPLNIANNDSDIRQHLYQKLSVINTELVGNNFIAIVALDIVQQIMEIAKSLDLVNTQNQWLYLISDTDFKNSNILFLRHILKEGDNIAFIYNTTIIDGKCMSGLKCHTDELLEAFSKALDAAILNENELASQVSDEEWEAIRSTKLERRDFLLHTTRSYLLEHGTCDGCNTWNFQTGETWGKEYQKNVADSSAELLEIGNWRPSDGLALKDYLFPHIVHGFRRKLLPMVTFHNPPWQILTYNDSGGVSDYGGLTFDIIKELSKNLNFTYTVTVTDNEKAVLRTRTNTSFNIKRREDLLVTERLTNVIPENIIDLVKNKSAALGACAFSITNEGKRFINFTAPISTQSYAFLVARPRELSRALLFMSPFTFNTWLCLAASVVIMGPILYIIHRFSPVYEYKGISQGAGLSTIQNCIWYMYGALLQQGGMHLPHADSARLIVGTWWLVVLVVATTYCGNLVAFLTFPKIDIPITTVNELLAHKDTVTWSTVQGSFFEISIKNSEDYKYRSLYNGMMKNDIDHQLMLTLVEKGKHVYFDWKTNLHFYMKRQFLTTDRCDLALGNEEFVDEQIAMIMAQDTPYLKLINEEIKRLHQVGLIEKWYQNYLPKKDRCFKVSRITEVTNHTVNMDDMQGSFFVLVIGFGIAFLWLLGEKVLHFYLVQKKQKVQPFVT